MHPVISVRLDRESGCFGTVPLVNLETGKYLRDVEFIRLHVKNTGLSTIKDCHGYITKLAKRAEKEEEEVVPRQEIVDLGWAHHPQSTARSIPRGAFFHMDVVSLNVMGERELRPLHLPTTLMEFFRGKGTYKAWILIAADNAKPREIVVEFACDPDHDELTPKEGNWEDYPWWKPWVDQWLKPWWRWLRKPRLDRLRHPWWKPWLDRLRYPWWKPW